jgi:hypothetical protein
MHVFRERVNAVLREWEYLRHAIVGFCQFKPIESQRLIFLVIVSQYLILY